LPRHDHDSPREFSRKKRSVCDDWRRYVSIERRRAATSRNGGFMARSYYSIILDHGADAVWAAIRPFDHYAWAGVESETIIEDGKVGDQVGAIRRVATGDKTIRQILLAHSDPGRSYSYALCDPPPFPVRNYTATIRVAPVVESGQAFVEWWATFDCAADEYDRWVRHFEMEGFAKWLAALRRFMAGGGGRR
jgi:hypothetical protein